MRRINIAVLALALELSAFAAVAGMARGSGRRAE
jgi:hypothetical protein